MRGSLLALALILVPAWAADNAALEQLNEPGVVALMRHSLAPGTGDPSSFDINDCATQRNLDAQGRQQAVRTGAMLRQSVSDSLHVYTSQWCRCQDTATLLNAGPVTALPALNSFFADRSTAGEQTRQMLAWLNDNAHRSGIVLVTHQVNITALTDVFPASGEIILVRLRDDGQLGVLGRVTTPVN